MRDDGTYASVDDYKKYPRIKQAKVLNRTPLTPGTI
jgi:hypothetical protein